LVHLVHLADLRERRVVVHAGLDGGGGGCCCDVLLVAAARVGVVMYPRVARQLVGSAEALCAARELAGVRLLASVRPDMTRLVLEAVEGLVAKRALVRARQVGAVFVRVLHVDTHRRHGHGCGGHRRAWLAAGLTIGLAVEVRRGVRGRGRGLLVGGVVERVGLHQRAALGIEKIREHVRRRRQCRAAVRDSQMQCTAARWWCLVGRGRGKVRCRERSGAFGRGVGGKREEAWAWGESRERAKSLRERKMAPLQSKLNFCDREWGENLRLRIGTSV